MEGPLAPPKEIAMNKLEFLLPSLREGLTAIAIIPGGNFIYDQWVQWTFHANRDLSHTLTRSVFCLFLWYVVCFVRRKPIVGKGTVTAHLSDVKQ
jgi:membrane-bound metal-dependent hydrolase YbcI (DUF457 family)